jgi:hypothetical protein
VSAGSPSVLDERTPLRSEGLRAPAPAGAQRQLGLDMERQSQTEWCWAAVSASLALFYDPRSAWTQCALANAELDQPGCCQDGGSQACNTPRPLVPPLQRVGHLAQSFAGSQDMTAIAAQIEAGRPIGLCISWSGGGGHFVVIDGYDEGAGLVDVTDPLYGHSYVALAAFPARYQGGGTWSWTYLTE